MMSTDLLAQFHQNWRFLSSVREVNFPPPPQWTTRHKVLLELGTMRLLDFGGEGPDVLVNTPYAGHSSTIADYDHGHSLIEVLLAAGHHVYCTDWKSATPTMAGFGIERYLTDLGSAIRAVGRPVHLIGLCQGGWLSAMHACLSPVQSLVLAGAPLDTRAGEGVLRQLADTYPLAYFRWLVACGGGLMRGKYMLVGWKSMHPEVHYWEKYLDLYERADDEKYVKRTTRFASWYEHTLDLPGAFYLETVEKLFQKNLFYKGELQLLGKRAELSDITCPVYLLAGADDDVTPPQQVLSAQSRFKNVRTAIAPGGHIGLFMGYQALGRQWTEIAHWIRELESSRPTSKN